MLLRLCSVQDCFYARHSFTVKSSFALKNYVSAKKSIFILKINDYLNR